MLLDTNVWSYVADQDAATDLREVARSHDLEILVSPAVVFEQLRMRNSTLRKSHLKVSTRHWWTRLMPETFTECDELVRAIGRHRPEWIINEPGSNARANFTGNRADWTHGFWDRARSNPGRQARLNEQLGGKRIAGARRAVEEKRTAARRDQLRLETPSLDGWHESTCEVTVGRRKVRTQWWRVGAANHFVSELLSAGPPTYRDWLDPFIDRRLLLDQNAWLDFWLEVGPEEVPTQWLTWAGGVLAPLVKVNQGTVFDVQLTGYLSSADVFVTADKNFHRIGAAIAAAAPFPVARPERTVPEGWLSTLESLR